MSSDIGAIKPYSDQNNPHFGAIQRNNRLGNIAKTVTIVAGLLTVGGLGVLAFLGYQYLTCGAGLSFPIAGFNLSASTLALAGTGGVAALAIAGGLWATGHAVAKKRAKTKYDAVDTDNAFSHDFVQGTQREKSAPEIKAEQNAAQAEKNARIDGEQLVKTFEQLSLEELGTALESLCTKNHADSFTAVNTLKIQLQMKYRDAGKTSSETTDKLKVVEKKLEDVEKEQRSILRKEYVNNRNPKNEIDKEKNDAGITRAETEKEAAEVKEKEAKEAELKTWKSVEVAAEKLARDLGSLKHEEFKEQLDAFITDLNDKFFNQDNTLYKEALNILYQSVKRKYCGRLQKMWPQTSVGKANLATKLGYVQSKMENVVDKSTGFEDSDLADGLPPVIDRLRGRASTCDGEA